VREPEARRIVHWALDQGINFIDTADVYEGYRRYLGSPGGVAESIVGAALAGRRAGAVVATKVGNPVGPTPAERGLGRKRVLEACDRSLARLGTDWIDLYYMHRPDPDTPLAESIEAFAHLVEAGKIRAWGLSNFDAAATRAVLDTCARHGWPRPVAQQPHYSLLERRIEADLLPLCRKERLAVIPYRVLEGGLLTGKYRDPAAPPAGSRGAEKPDWLPKLHDAATRAELDRLGAEAQAAGVGLTEHAIRATLEVPGITSPILGVKTIDQLAQALAAL
jgi:aryl-alcohol dehydrogenase-like predicted oxidoreductase